MGSYLEGVKRRIFKGIVIISLLNEQWLYARFFTFIISLVLTIVL